MQGIIIVVWIIAILGVGAGVLILVGGFATASGAPQEAVVAALACACAILPYCFARAVTELVRSGKN